MIMALWRRGPTNCYITQIKAPSTPMRIIQRLLCGNGIQLQHESFVETLGQFCDGKLLLLV